MLWDAQSLLYTQSYRHILESYRNRSGGGLNVTSLLDPLRLGLSEGLYVRSIAWGLNLACCMARSWVKLAAVADTANPEANDDQTIKRGQAFGVDLGACCQAWRKSMPFSRLVCDVWARRGRAPCLFDDDAVSVD